MRHEITNTDIRDHILRAHYRDDSIQSCEGRLYIHNLTIGSSTYVNVFDPLDDWTAAYVVRTGGTIHYSNRMSGGEVPDRFTFNIPTGQDTD